jgi:hypothetical protein
MPDHAIAPGLGWDEPFRQVRLLSREPAGRPEGVLVFLNGKRVFEGWQTHFIIEGLGYI